MNIHFRCHSYISAFKSSYELGQKILGILGYIELYSLYEYKYLNYDNATNP